MLQHISIRNGTYTFRNILMTWRRKHQNNEKKCFRKIVEPLFVKLQMILAYQSTHAVTSNIWTFWDVLGIKNVWQQNLFQNDTHRYFYTITKTKKRAIKGKCFPQLMRRAGIDIRVEEHTEKKHWIRLAKSPSS